MSFLDFKQKLHRFKNINKLTLCVSSTGNKKIVLPESLKYLDLRMGIRGPDFISRRTSLETLKFFVSDFLNSNSALKCISTKCLHLKSLILLGKVLG